MCTKPLTWFPLEPSLDRFFSIASNSPLGQYFMNTALLSITAPVLATIVSFLAAYSIVKLTPPGANLVLVGLMASTMVPWVATVIPLFEMFRDLKLQNTFTGLLILYGSFMLPVTTWVLVNTLRAVPDEIEDAAKIDGAGIFQVIFQILFPICRSGIATMIVINVVAAWNQFFIPLVFGSGDQSKVLPLIVIDAGRLAASATTSGWLLNTGDSMAAGLITIIPVFIITLVFQRQIVEGISGGVYK